MAQGFTLDLVEGELLIRDAAEPLALENPTTISGTHDTGEGGTGAITGGSFATPAIAFDTTALGFNVHVLASFSEVSPGTGSIDAGGNVTFNASVNVHLSIDVGDSVPPLLHGDCDAGPVSLSLESTAPWNTNGDDEVTVADANFGIPAVVATPTCDPVIVNGINDQLQGPGHSLEMTLEGPLELPTPSACKTITTLAIDPSGGEVLQGKPVTFTSTVVQDPAFASDPACDDVEDGQIPTGLVELRAGGTLLGTGALDGTGTATLTTETISAGTFPIVATYRGEAPFGKSSAAAQNLKVAARPSVTADVPDSIVIDSDFTEIDATITNNSLGSTVNNARLDLSMLVVNPQGGPISALSPVEVKVEYHDGTTWVPVTASGFQPVIANASPLTGFPLPADSEVVRRFRVKISEEFGPIGPKTVDLTLQVMGVAPGTGEPVPAPADQTDELTEMTARVLLAPEARLPTSITASITPHTLRQGQMARIGYFLNGSFEGIVPGGTVSVLLDGKPVNIRENGSPPELGFVPSVSTNGTNAEFPIPDDAPTGQRTITFRYSGNAFYEPSEWTANVYVLASRGPTYVCSSNLFTTDLIYVNMVARANMGTVRPSGGTLDLAQLDVALQLDRGDAAFLGMNLKNSPVVPPATVTDFSINEISFDFAGPGTGTSNVTGTGTAETFTVANNTPMDDSTKPVDPNPDQTFGFTRESASLTVTGEPGDTIPVNLSSVLIKGGFWFGFGDPFPFTLDCTPLTDPVTIGQVTVAGTTLTVDSPTPTRLGDEVTLTAKVAPVGTPGTVELRDGTNTLTVVPVRSDGTATYTTNTLTIGTHDLSARFSGGLTSVSTRSAPVTLDVLPETDCEQFAEAGHGAVVRLVYLELLGRCPDQAGYDHWVARLEGGTSAEAFARTISRTNEAVGRVVDDAYQTMLGRAPDAAGRTFWIGRLQANGRYHQLLADLAGSGEFWALSGSTNTGFVTRVYERLLDRAPDPGGLDHWVGHLDNGTSRKVLVRSLANQNEPLSRIVTASYDEILSRAPGSSERSASIEYLRQTGDRSALYAQLIGRPEFATRAGTFPNPED